MTSRHIKAALDESAAALARLTGDSGAIESIARAGLALAECFESAGRVFACGNGGSMSDAMHFAEELSGKFRKERRALPAAAISDPGHLSCAANDYGYESVFARYLEAHARRGDALLAISTSGRSPNVVRAAALARELGLTVVALTGRAATPLAREASIEICTPFGEWSDRVQELHIKVIHILVELVERRLFPENYAD
ncbi:MAG: SIS domain-containing protein [Acidobacteria bacterium]|nr:SIS domain-containing protein [Acidobacteriota bacterium]